MFVGAYVGARPLGRPLPPLGDAPAHPAVPLHLLYAFARDAAHDGVFEFYGKRCVDVLAASEQRAAVNTAPVSLSVPVARLAPPAMPRPLQRTVPQLLC